MTWHRFDQDCILDPGTEVTRVDRYGFQHASCVKYLLPGDVFFEGDVMPPGPIPDRRPIWLIEADKAHSERLLRKPDAVRPDPPKSLRRPRNARV